MVWVLPEILFRDDEKDIQIYEDEPEPIFKINIIQKFAKTKLARYTTTFYKQGFKFILDQFKSEFDYITNFLLVDNIKKLPAPPTFIVDDTDDEYRVTIEDEDEANFSFLKWIKEVWRLTKIRKWIKKIRRMWRAFKRAKRYITKKFKQALKKFRKTWKRTRTHFRILKKRAKRFYKNILRPWWRRAKKRFWRWCRKLKRILRRCAKKWKRVLRIFKRRITRTLRKLAIRVIRKLSRQIFKKVVQQLLKWVAGLISATGVGAVIGAVLFAAAVAWEVYDFTHGDEEDVTGRGMENQPVKENKIDVKKTVNEDYHPPVVQTEKSLMEQGMQINMMTQLQVNKHLEKIHDNVSRTLFDSQALPYQIFGRLYIFWRLCVNWLEGQQVLVTNIMDVLPKKTNHYFDKIMEWTDSQEIKELPAIIHQKFNKFAMIDLDVQGKKYTQKQANKMKAEMTRTFPKFIPYPLDAAIQSFVQRQGIKKMYGRFQEFHERVFDKKTNKVDYKKLLYYIKIAKTNIYALGDNIHYKIINNERTTEMQATLRQRILALIGGGKDPIDNKFYEIKPKQPIQQSRIIPPTIGTNDIFAKYNDTQEKKLELLITRATLLKEISNCLPVI